MTDHLPPPPEPSWGVGGTTPPTPPTPPAGSFPPPPGSLPPPPAGPPPAGPPPATPPSVPPGPPPDAVPFVVGGGPPSGRPWWKQPWAIVVAVLAVAALVVGVVVVTGGDDEGRVATEDTEPEDTEPEDTEPEATEPEATEPLGTAAPATEAPGTTVPLTLPTTVAPQTTVAPETTVAAAGAVPIGSSVALQGSTETIEATVLAVADPAPTYDFSPPTAGFRAVALQVRAVNTGSVEYFDDADGMRLIDASGASIDSSFLPVALSGTFPLTRLQPGDVRVGWIVYEVAEGAPIASFQWNLDGPSADAPAVWDLLAAPVAASPTPAPLPGSIPFNAPARLSGGSGTVDVAVVSVTDPAAQIAGEAPLLPGTRLVAFEIALFNSGTAPFAESPDTFMTLVDANGQWYTSSFLGTTSGPAFAAELVMQPGEQLIAYVTFELPVGETPLKLQTALDFGTATQSAELAVG